MDLQKQIDTLTTKVNEIKSTPGPQGEQGPPGPQGVMGLQGPAGTGGGVTFVPCYYQGVNWHDTNNILGPLGHCEFTCSPGQYIWAVSEGSVYINKYQLNYVEPRNGTKNSLIRPYEFEAPPTYFEWVQCAPNNYI